MKNYLKKFGMPTIVAVSTLSVTVSAKPVLQEDNCGVAVDIFNPSADYCVGAYEGNDNDPNSTLTSPIDWSSTGGPSSDVALGLLNNDANVEAIFGSEDWTGLEKIDLTSSSVTGNYFLEQRLFGKRL